MFTSARHERRLRDRPVNGTSALAEDGGGQQNLISSLKPVLKFRLPAHQPAVGSCVEAETDHRHTSSPTDSNNAVARSKASASRSSHLAAMADKSRRRATGFPPVADSRR